MIITVQPFSLGGAGGGSRILRALFLDAPFEWRSAVFQPNFAEETDKEFWIKSRPWFGKIERSRFSRYPTALDRPFISQATKRLHARARDLSASGLHVIMHGGWESISASRVAQQLKIPLHLSVHDDPHYLYHGFFGAKFLDEQMAIIWKQASSVHVISQEMGQELCRRWGQRSYNFATDGVTQVAEAPKLSPANRLTVYFMGLMHLSYEPNLIALQKAVQLFSTRNPGVECKIVMRCGTVRSSAILNKDLVELRPFAPESEVLKDMESVDVLYQPLSLAAKDERMAAYSLSTKMVTYLASGIPILFHGPQLSAAGQLLTRNEAAFCCASNEPEELAKLLQRAKSDERVTSVMNALALSSRDFLLEKIQKRFWKALTQGSSSDDVTPTVNEQP